MHYDEVLERLKSLSNPKALSGMARFGIDVSDSLGVSLPELRRLAKETGKDHGLALRLWRSGIHDAMLLATIVDDPDAITEGQAEEWVRDIHSWDVCDLTCNLLSETGFGHRKAVEWSRRNEEFVKRAGFVLMACLAVHDKKAPDSAFERFFPIIKRESSDGRNFVKKAVNWALRQIGKRNRNLNRLAIEAAEDIRKTGTGPARWIASDALRELRSEAVQRRLERKA